MKKVKEPKIRPTQEEKLNWRLDVAEVKAERIVGRAQHQLDTLPLRIERKEQAEDLRAELEELGYTDEEILAEMELFYDENPLPKYKPPVKPKKPGSK
jgi:hypothetical protein